MIIALKYYRCSFGYAVNMVVCHISDSTDIVDCKLKLILGLIWTLILHYSISMPMWEGEDDTPYGEGKGPTPKQR
jgi:filamin